MNTWILLRHFLKQNFHQQINFILRSRKKEFLSAVEVWKQFKIKNLGEWHDLYLKLDVLLLTDVFENFRDLCLEKSYGLDPVWYYTTPGLAWEIYFSGIKTTQIFTNF